MEKWKLEAERLKFEDCLSWVQVYEAMQPHFPDLNIKQVEEKVRGYLRKTDQYKTPKLDYKGNNKFKYKKQSLNRRTLHLCWLLKCIPN